MNQLIAVIEAAKSRDNWLEPEVVSSPNIQTLIVNNIIKKNTGIRAIIKLGFFGVIKLSMYL